tara:strand:+ start:5878 stop:6006 length:129 start_codon:yes stop_codon:yes gene_type:complete
MSKPKEAIKAIEEKLKNNNSPELEKSLKEKLKQIKGSKTILK